MIHGILAEAFSGKNPFENDLELEGESATDTNDTDEVQFYTIIEKVPVG